MPPPPFLLPFLPRAQQQQALGKSGGVPGRKGGREGRKEGEPVEEGDIEGHRGGRFMDVVAVEARERPVEEGGEEGEEDGLRGQEERLGQNGEGLEGGRSLVRGGEGVRVQGLREEGEGVLGYEGGAKARQGLQGSLSRRDDRRTLIEQALVG